MLDIEDTIAKNENDDDDDDEDDTMIRQTSKQFCEKQQTFSSFLAKRLAEKGELPTKKYLDAKYLEQYSPKMQKILGALPMAPLNDVVEAPNAIEQSLPRKVLELHDAAMDRGDDNYTDPDTGYFVFTRLSHIKRGRCCGSACRHCPYNHTNVSADRKLFLKLKQVGSEATEQKSAEKREEKQDGVQEAGEHPQTQQPQPLSAQLRRTKTGEVTGAVYTRTGDKGTSGLLSGERRGKSDGIFDILGTVDELNSNIGAARVEVQLLFDQLKTTADATSSSGSDSDGGSSGGGGGGGRAKAVAASAFSRQSRDLQRMKRRNVQDLVWIQERLLDCGALVAMASDKSGASTHADNDTVSVGVAEWIRKLEALIDAQNKQLPPLVSFILPCGGNRASAQLHICRSVCRRAERCLWKEMTDESAAAGHHQDHLDRCECVAKFLNRLSDFLFTSARLWSSKSEENSASASEFQR